MKTSSFSASVIQAWTLQHVYDRLKQADCYPAYSIVGDLYGELWQQLSPEEQRLVRPLAQIVPPQQPFPVQE